MKAGILPSNNIVSSTRKIMSTVDYSKYSVEELLDVQSRISSDSPNYPALIAELDARKKEIDEFAVKKEQHEFSIMENRVKIIGYFQLAAAAVILIMFMLLVIDGSASILSSSIAIIAIALNAIAGYTAVKEMHDKYWISVLNQLLQVPGPQIERLSGIGKIAENGDQICIVHTAWLLYEVLQPFCYRYF